MYTRQKQKNSLTEIYGVNALPIIQGKANVRGQQRERALVPMYMNPAVSAASPLAAGQSLSGNVQSDGSTTYRRTTKTRQKRSGGGVEDKVRAARLSDKDDKLMNMSCVGKDNSKMMTTRIDKSLENPFDGHSYYDTFENFLKAQAQEAYQMQQQPQLKQQKHQVPQQIAQHPQQQQPQQHQQQQQHHQQKQCHQQQKEKRNNVEEERDEDTEEFVALIQQTVETAIGKSISELLNRNFQEIASKIDGFSEELKATQKLISSLQTDMLKKVVHYGEENSRHFRYLCMKSEYDKMFYQHQSMVNNTNSGNVVPFTPQIPMRPCSPTTQLFQQISSVAPPGSIFLKMPNEVFGVDSNGQCTCRSVQTGKNMTTPRNGSQGQQHQQVQQMQQQQQQQQQNVSTKCAATECQMMAADQSQRYRGQFQPADSGNGSTATTPTNNNSVNPGNNNQAYKQPSGSNQRPHSYRPEDAIRLNKQVFLEDDDDDDDCMLSMDALSAHSMDQMHKYESKAKMLSSQRAKLSYPSGGGGGDAQF